MIKINKLSRKFYAGENIVVERIYQGGRWQDIVENVPNAVINSQTSNQAVVLGNGPGRLDFDLSTIKRHKGGLLGSKALQIYGCNALYRDFTPDFLVAVGNDIVKEIADSGYTDNNIVYTSSIHMLTYPNKFYLIPHDPYTDAGTTAAYIAAFDGHKKIFMIGFDGQDKPGYNYNVYADTACYQPINTNVLTYKWMADRRVLFDTYDDVEFIQVSLKGTERVPDEWKSCMNFRIIGLNQFVIEANL
jgi:hypothetical protein